MLGKKKSLYRSSQFYSLSLLHSRQHLLIQAHTNGGHNRINHVGMYIGGGKFIQASSEYSSVVISDITDGFYANTYMTAF
jgi:cell wall-associated NlpC family hydrolase